MKPHDIEATAKARRRIPHLAFPDDGACQFLGVIAGVVGEGDGGAARDAFDVVGDRCHAARANVAEQAVQVDPQRCPAAPASMPLSAAQASSLRSSKTGSSGRRRRYEVPVKKPKAEWLKVMAARKAAAAPAVGEWDLVALSYNCKRR